MIVKIFGLADLLAVIALLGSSLLPKQILIIMSLYLIIKGIFFLLLGGSPLSNIFDSISGFYITLVAYGLSHWIPTVIVTIYILQKAIISLL